MPKTASPASEQALTKVEQRKLEKVSTTIESVCQTAEQVEDEEGNKVVIMTPELHAEVMSAIRKKRISTSSLLAICDKVESCKWWTIRVRINFNPDEPFVNPILETNTGIRKVLTPEEYPAFFKAYKGELKDKRLALALPDTFKFISVADLKMVQSLRHMLVAVEVEESEPGYISIPYNHATSALGNVGRRAFELRHEDDRGNGLLLIDKGNVTVALNKASFDEGRIVIENPNADKLFIQILEKAKDTRFINNVVEVTLDEMMTARGLSDKKEAKKSMELALDTIEGVTIRFQDSKTGEYFTFPLIQGHGYRNGGGTKSGRGFVVLSDAFLNYLQHTSSYGQYPSEILKIPGKNPTDYYIVKQFSEHKRRNVTKTNQDRLKVATLLEACYLPLADSIPRKRIPIQIIKPFFEALDRIEERGIFGYIMYKGRGAELTDEELDQMHTDYEFFSSLVVQAVWPENQPDYSELIEKKRNRAKKRSKKRTTSKTE